MESKKVTPRWVTIMITLAIVAAIKPVYTQLTGSDLVLTPEDMEWAQSAVEIIITLVLVGGAGWLGRADPRIAKVIEEFNQEQKDKEE